VWKKKKDRKTRGVKEILEVRRVDGESKGKVFSPDIEKKKKKLARRGWEKKRDAYCGKGIVTKDHHHSGKRGKKKGIPHEVSRHVRRKNEQLLIGARNKKEKEGGKTGQQK